MEFQTAKNVFTIGLILSLVLWNIIIPGITIIGVILTLIGIHALSQHYGRPDLFRNMLYAVIVQIVGMIIMIIVYFAAFFAALSINYISQSPFLFSVFLPLLAMWIWIWIISIIAAIFIKRAYTGLYEASGVDSFKTAAKLIWIGALTLVILVGAVISLIGHIFAIIGAFELKPPVARTQSGPTSDVPHATN